MTPILYSKWVILNFKSADCILFLGYLWATLRRLWVTTTCISVIRCIFDYIVILKLWMDAVIQTRLEDRAVFLRIVGSCRVGIRGNRISESLLHIISHSRRSFQTGIILCYYFTIRRFDYNQTRILQ